MWRIFLADLTTRPMVTSHLAASLRELGSDVLPLYFPDEMRALAPTVIQEIYARPVTIVLLPGGVARSHLPQIVRHTLTMTLQNPLRVVVPIFDRPSDEPTVRERGQAGYLSLQDADDLTAGHAIVSRVVMLLTSATDRHADEASWSPFEWLISGKVCAWEGHHERALMCFTRAVELGMPRKRIVANRPIRIPCLATGRKALRWGGRAVGRPASGVWVGVMWHFMTMMGPLLRWETIYFHATPTIMLPGLLGGRPCCR